MTTAQRTQEQHRHAQPQAEAVIDLDAVAANVRLLCRYAGDAAVMAVVKADAYNHGAVPVARAALAAGARELGVTTLTEALELKSAGIDAPVLSWLHTPDADYAPAITAGVELGVSSPRHLAAVAAAARDTGVTAVITVKVDTGLNRGGVARDQWPDFLRDLGRAHADGAVRLRRPRGRPGAAHPATRSAAWYLRNGIGWPWPSPICAATACRRKWCTCRIRRPLSPVPTCDLT